MPTARETWFRRNADAQELEADGKALAALQLYEENAREGADTSFTYERMAAIYANAGRHRRAIGALRKAVEIERERGPSSKLAKLEKHLDRAIAKKEEADRAAQKRKQSVRKTKKNGASASSGCLSLIAVLLFPLAAAGIWLLA